MSPAKCLPTCDERHDEACPAPAAEAAYWFRYFGLRGGTDAATKAHNQAQLAAFAPTPTQCKECEDDLAADGTCARCIATANDCRDCGGDAHDGLDDDGYCEPCVRSHEREADAVALEDRE